MSKRLHKQIARICLQDAPCEACGVIQAGKAIRLDNASTKPEETFVISARDILKWKPETIFHSHPRGDEGFSEHDLLVAANMDLTTYVYVNEADRLEKWSAESGLEVFETVLKS